MNRPFVDFAVADLSKLFELERCGDRPVVYETDSNGTERGHKSYESRVVILAEVDHPQFVRYWNERVGWNGVKEKVNEPSPLRQGDGQRDQPDADRQHDSEVAFPVFVHGSRRFSLQKKAK